MLRRKNDVIVASESELHINGDRAILADHNRRVLIVDPGDWNRYRISQINETLDHNFETDWFLASRGAGRQARWGGRRGEPRRGAIQIQEDSAVLLPLHHDTDNVDLAGRDLPAGINSRRPWHYGRLTNTIFRRSHFGPPSDFHTCDMRQVEFLNRCSFTLIQFRNCNLEGANFSDSVLTRVDFYQCELSEVNFTDCIFDNVLFRACTGGTAAKMPGNQHRDSFIVV